MNAGWAGGNRSEDITVELFLLAAVGTRFKMMKVKKVQEA